MKQPEVALHELKKPTAPPNRLVCDSAPLIEKVYNMDSKQSDIIKKFIDVLETAKRELNSCQVVLWQLEREGVDPSYGKGARAAIADIENVLKLSKE